MRAATFIEKCQEGTTRERGVEVGEAGRAGRSGSEVCSFAVLEETGDVGAAAVDEIGLRLGSFGRAKGHEGVPADQDDVLVLADRGGELIEELLHRVGVGVRQHEREGIRRRCKRT